MYGRLKGKVALVTGGCAGIGAECCKLFAAEGAAVLAADINPLPYQSEQVRYIHMDVADTKSCEEAIDDVLRQHGRIDILVNNAGVTRDGLLHKTTDEMWDTVLAINLKGVFNVTRLVAPQMVANGYGSVINVSSVVGEYGNIGQTNYSAAKAGVLGMTKTWAKEFARKGANVRVNAIAPGYVMTDILKTVPQELLDKFAAATMLGRLGQPEEIARAILFLASEDASYVTGHVLDANGGMRL